MSHMNAVVAVFESHDHAEDAIHGLQQNGFDLNNLSSVAMGSDTEQPVPGCHFNGVRMIHWGRAAFWGRLNGLLQGSGAFYVPGSGQLLVAGPLVSWIIGALKEGTAFGGVPELGAGLFSIGIPRSSGLKYETEVKNGKLLVVAQGTLDEVKLADAILKRRHAQTSAVHTQQSMAVV